MNVLDLLKPKEVRWTLRELDRCIWTGPDQLYDFRGAISKRCKQIIRNSDRTCYSIRVDRHSPTSLALLIAIDVTESMILSGQYHMYRGILAGNGHGLMRLLNHLFQMQMNAGLVSKEDLNQTLANIEKEIGSIG